MGVKSSSVTFVLMDFVRREGMEFTPWDPIGSHRGNQKSLRGALVKWLVASRWIFSKFPYSNLGSLCSTRLGGDVSVQLPVPKAPLFHSSPYSRIKPSHSARTAGSPQSTAE